MKTEGNGSIDLLKALRTFAATVESTNFSTAGRELGVTPGAVSKQIGMLESFLGRRLFQRTTRRLSVTDEGRRLYAMVREPARQIDDAIAALSSDETQLAGTVKVSLPMAFSRAAILPLMQGFQARYPNISLDLRFENRAVDLIAEGYDCAIGQMHDADSGLVARTLLPLTLVLCAAPAYLDRAGEPESIEALANHRHIVFRSPRTGRVASWKLRARTKEFVFEPNAQLAVTDTEAATELAVCGCGIALLGAHHVAALVAAGRLRVVLPQYTAQRSPICIYYAARKHLPPRVAAFVEYVVDEVRKGPLIKASKALLQRRAAR